MPADHRRAITTATGPPRARTAVVVAVALTALLGLGVVAGPVGRAGAATGQPAVPPIRTVVIATSLPGFTVAPPGPTNGPLTATGFAAQSSDPTQAEQQFSQLAGTAGFAAYVRLWSDLHGPGNGANDVVVTLFRIPDAQAAATFEEGAQAQAEQGTGSTSFPVPSIPGAHGTTVHATSPAPAVEQVVVFRSGAYVAIVQLASSTESSNPTSLTRADAIDVAYRQFLATQRASVAVPPAATPTTGGGTSWWLVVVIVVVLGAAAGAVLLVRRRRPDGRVVAGPDPWADDGVLAAMGAVTLPAGAAGMPTDGPGGASPPPVPVPDPGATPDVTGDQRSPEAGATTPTAVDGPSEPAPPTRSDESPRPPVAPPDEPGPGTGPGWLPDPSGAPDHLRYWDGRAWTPHVAAPAADR